MTADRPQRRIAAVLAADVVGYSRLVGKDEEATLARLKRYRNIIDGLIVEHGGRVFGSAGDSVLAEFPSSVEAVRCATEIQLALERTDVEEREPDAMRLRIGVNLGDIVVDGTNLLGDGVNVAARLEALAPPGGLCVSEAVHAQVRDRLSLMFLDLGEHKVENIARPIRAYRVPLASEEAVRSPFRGLDPFSFEDASLFFGRAHAISSCLERLQQLAAAGKAFLLIYGSSGSGKSSLLRAGLLPRLLREDALPGIVLWRRSLIRPSEAADPLISLAAGLMREGALPELAYEIGTADLAMLLREGPERVLPAIRAALTRAAAAAGLRPAQARLVLAVDQMEELFTTAPTPAAREAFVRLLGAFARGGSVIVIGTIRADFYPRCSEIPGFSALKDGLSSFELPPGGAEIAQIIREPARAAGLRFEEDRDLGHLDDVLQAAAMSDRHSLPLLEFTLDALCAAGREQRLMTFAAYRALGGLEGAIARRADDVIDALPMEIQDALPAVIRALTTVRVGDDAVAGRPAPLHEVGAPSQQQALLDALIAARLLVSDEDAEGRPVVRLAHEALIFRWPRAKEIVDADRSFLETRARIHADAKRWIAEGRNQDLLLPPGKRLAEGDELLAYRRADLDEAVIAYIEASAAAEELRKDHERQAERRRIEAEGAAARERLEHEAERLEHEAERTRLEAKAAQRLARRTRVAAAVMLVLGVGAAAGAVVGFLGQQEALRQQQEAVRQQQEAVRQAERASASAQLARAAETSAIDARNEALRAQSLSLAYLSEQRAADGDSEAAILLAREALPKNLVKPDRPLVLEAQAGLYRALLKHHPVLVLAPEGLADAMFDASGERVVTASSDGIARIVRAEDGATLAILKGHEGPLHGAVFDAQGERVLTASRDGTARVWDARSGALIETLDAGAPLRSASFSPDGSRVFTRSERGEVVIRDPKTGATLARLSDAAATLAFSPDGRMFATTDTTGRTVRIWAAAEGKLLRDLDVLTYADDLAFDPTSSRILASSWGAPYSGFPTGRILSVTDGKVLADLTGHISDSQCGLFSHDGRLIATSALDGTARLWDPVSGWLRGVLGQEAAGLRLQYPQYPHDPDARCSFSPDDRLLATGALDGTIRLWDVRSGTLTAFLERLGGPVERLAFSPDGSLLLAVPNNGKARLWATESVLETALPEQNAPTFGVFSRDGSRLATGGGSSVVHVWDVAKGRQMAALNTKSGLIGQCAFGPDEQIATGSQVGRIALWDARTGSQLAQLQEQGASVLALQFGADGHALLSASGDGTIVLWDVAHRTAVWTKGLGRAARQAFLSPDGRFVLAITADGALRLWRADGTELPSVGDGMRVTAAAFTADGRLLAGGSGDGTTRIWSVAKGVVRHVLKGSTSAISSLSFSHDGRWLAATSRSGATSVFNVETGLATRTIDEAGDVVTEVAFSPDDRLLATVSPQKARVTLWSAENGREIADLAKAPKADPAVTHAAFSPDGRHIAVVSGEKVTRLVRVFPTAEELLEFSRKVVPRELTPCERKRYFLPGEQPLGECPS